MVVHSSTWAEERRRRKEPTAPISHSYADTILLCLNIHVFFEAEYLLINAN